MKRFDLIDLLFDLLLMDIGAVIPPKMEVFMRKLVFLILLLISCVSFASNVIHYPERAEKLRIDGEVDVIYDVNDRGTPENIRVLNANPRYVFDREVQKQIATWKYPSGKPESDIPLRVIFKAN